jgi:hypothetical protein
VQMSYASGIVPGKVTEQSNVTPHAWQEQPNVRLTPVNVTLLPLSPRSIQMPMSPRSIQMPLSPRDIQMPISPRGNEMPMSPRDIQMPMSPRSIQLPPVSPLVSPRLTHVSKAGRPVPPRYTQTQVMQSTDHQSRHNSPQRRPDSDTGAHVSPPARMQASQYSNNDVSTDYQCAETGQMNQTQMQTNTILSPRFAGGAYASPTTPDMTHVSPHIQLMSAQPHTVHPPFYTHWAPNFSPFEYVDEASQPAQAPVLTQISPSSMFHSATLPQLIARVNEENYDREILHCETYVPERGERVSRQSAAYSVNNNNASRPKTHTI